MFDAINHFSDKLLESKEEYTTWLETPAENTTTER
jgi:hypothetical protein